MPAITFELAEPAGQDETVIEAIAAVPHARDRHPGLST